MIDDTLDAAPAAQLNGDERFHLRSHYRQHGVYVTEHRLEVPLDHADPSGPTISIFARELSLSRNEGPCCDQPAIIFMQGGPGGRAPRPGDFRSGWIGHALKTHRVILLDERGTGQSTRLDALTLSEFDTAEDAAKYVRHFRADSMVEDAELLRHAINASRPWACLGQSYGGFITTTYLSRHPEGLSEAYFTGGLPGLVDLEDIYLRTYQLTAERNRVYFERYPEDQDTLRTVLKHLDTHEEFLPSGERLTGRRLRMLGMMLGTTTGFDQLHYFFEGPFTFVGGQTRLNTQFLDMVWRQVSMGDSPMYALLHETIYAAVTPALAGKATDWTAHRLLQRVGEDVDAGFAPNPDLDGDDPVFLTGEHIYPWLFSEDPALTSMRELAHVLATDTSWPALYDEDVLAANEVPAAAAVYAEDMFVPMDLSLQTARLANVRPWITNEFQHDGLRADGARVLSHLMELSKD
ncbi:MAG: alpha/beta fold hydrolase [Actinomycetaceae bacterium]|nr:alpha/beta fold hydrolase [Actinomycetaceae bacterium]